ncbi:MAG: acido-empty-quinoprotein group A [Chloracidobacterium sp.]|nr:acido-empty-quinoprotein group A [Chloracidobacterium sp.]
MKKLNVILFLCLLSSIAAGQSLDSDEILKPLSDSWLTYSGDYTSKRYSALKQINQLNVKNLTLAWATRVTAGLGQGGGGGRFGGPSFPTIVGGEGSQDAGPGTNIRASILQVDGALYLSTPDNAWAVDARDGTTLWHYVWKTKGGTHIGNRGLAMWKNWLYMETPDDFLICLDAKTGKERWHKVIASFDEQYFSTMAPVVVGDHLLVGTGCDMDAPGFLQSFDPDTGEVQWKWYAVPMKKGDPGLETWASLDAARHGGGNIWIPGSYDPETKLYITGTGNPTPAYTGQSRGEGENLYTCALVAINVETGKLAWHFSLSPHDTHDWDSAQTPVLVDAPFNGKMRKLVMTAQRNGYFFVLDRLTGEHLVTTKYSDTVNWANGIDKRGAPERIPEKDYHIGGALVSPNNGGVTNWPPPCFSPDTGLFYVPQSDNYAMYYLTETDPRGAMGLGGKEEVGVATLGNYLTAIDYKTGKVAWRHRYPGVTGGRGMNGLLATAGRLVFGGDIAGNLVAYDAALGKPLWHARLGQVSNAPETYLLDGKQYLLVAAGDTLYAFYLY